MYALSKVKYVTQLFLLYLYLRSSVYAQTERTRSQGVKKCEDITYISKSTYRPEPCLHLCNRGGGLMKLCAKYCSEYIKCEKLRAKSTANGASHNHTNLKKENKQAVTGDPINQIEDNDGISKTPSAEVIIAIAVCGGLMLVGIISVPFIIKCVRDKRRGKRNGPGPRGRRNDDTLKLTNSGLNQIVTSAT